MAKWWGLTPADLRLRKVSVREFRVMAEFMYRVNKEEREAIEDAKAGYPVGKRPRPGDTIAERPDDRW